MGLGCSKGGLQTGFCDKTSIFGCKSYKITSKISTCNKKRNRKSFREKGNRDCTSTRDKFRFLQHVISSTQKERGNETSYKLKTPQRVSPEETFQNGHSKESDRSCKERRLGIYSRFERCIFPYKDFQEPPSVSKVSISRGGLPVQGSLLRADKCSKGIYKSHGCGSSSLKKTKHSVSQLPRRLVGSKLSEAYVVARQDDSVKTVFSTGSDCKQRKIATHAGSKHNIHRQFFQFCDRSSFSNKGETDKFETSSKENFEWSQHCKTFHESARNDCLMSRTHTECKVVYEANTASSSKKLESSSNEYVSRNNGDSSVNFGSELVVSGSEHSTGQIFSKGPIFGNTNHRCQWMGLGRSFRQPYMSGSVEQYAETDAHKLFGNDGCTAELTAVPITLEEQEYIGQVGQHNSLPIHKSTRGYKITSVMQDDVRSMAMGYTESGQITGSTYNGQEKCISRCFEPGTGQTNRVVIEQYNSPEHFSTMGVSNDGSFCNVSKQENSSVLFMGASSSSFCFGCPVNCMAEHVCVCVPPNSAVNEGIDPFSEVSMHNDSNSTTVATSDLLHSPVEVFDSASVETSMQSGDVDTVQGPDITSESGVLTPDCMAVIDRRMSSRGFSKNTCRLLAKSWRSGTQKDYKSKFKRFSGWCLERDIDPYLASLTNCADFLTSLFEDGLKYRTINGYRSMLSAVLAPVGNIPVGQHPFVIRLLRAVFNERPPKKKLVPEWNLLFVLERLKKEPFEPLREASLKWLTWKTCFLLAITSYRRCSDLQSLQLGEGSVNVQKQGITFIRTGLSKQDRPSHMDRKIFIPALSDNKLLDPKRALAYYLKKTECYRKSGSDQEVLKLFLAIKKPNKPVSSQTISRWLVDTIKYCYKKEQKTVKNVKGHSTRSVGPSWALFKGASLQQVMEAADWSRETTFTKFYLKNINTDYMKV